MILQLRCEKRKKKYVYLHNKQLITFWNHLVMQMFGVPDHVLFFLLSFSSNNFLFPKMMWGFFLHL